MGAVVLMNNSELIAELRKGAERARQSHHVKYWGHTESSVFCDSVADALETAEATIARLRKGLSA
ncbi:hypothetical protein ABIB56_000807 [Glaciihabitans sp. UYNi722]